MKRWSVKIKWTSTTGNVVERTIEVDEFTEIDGYIELDQDWTVYPTIEITMLYNYNMQVAQ